MFESVYFIYSLVIFIIDSAKEQKPNKNKQIISKSETINVKK